MTLVKWIEPEEEGCPLDAVKLYQVADKMTVDDRTAYATEKILLKHFVRLLGVTHIACLLLVHGVE
ncbi:MAG: hypothetical protein K2L31_03805, partial [Muribaculum sp.]|nr:hypothetical protein [Muribaculum sp.]